MENGVHSFFCVWLRHQFVAMHIVALLIISHVCSCTLRCPCQPDCWRKDCCIMAVRFFPPMLSPQVQTVTLLGRQSHNCCSLYYCMVPQAKRELRHDTLNPENTPNPSVQSLPNWHQEEEENRETHLEIGQRCKTKATHHHKLTELQEGEEMHFPLWHTADVMVWWVCRLQKDKSKTPGTHSVLAHARGVAVSPLHGPLHTAWTFYKPLTCSVTSSMIRSNIWLCRSAVTAR